jgi:hypothetical protein
MKFLIIVIVSILFQTSKPMFEIPGETEQIYTDNLGSLYLVKDFSLYKYNSSGNLLFTYSDNYLGKISSIAIGEGLKTLVYYGENAQMIMLDNTLSRVSEPINLNFSDLGTATLATTSVQNSFWFFEPLQGEIVRTTNTINIIFRSGNLDQMLNYHINPNFMIEFNNNLYLNDPKIGVLVFDIFGTYLKTIPIMGLEKFQVAEKGLYFYRDNHLFYYDFKDFNQSEIPLPAKGVLQALVSNKMMFIQTNQSVSGWDRKSILK